MLSLCHPRSSSGGTLSTPHRTTRLIAMRLRASEPCPVAVLAAQRQSLNRHQLIPKQSASGNDVVMYAAICPVVCIIADGGVDGDESSELDVDGDSIF